MCLFPCKNCDSRTLGRHASCEAYLKAVEEKRELNKRIKFERETNSAIIHALRFQRKGK